ncbi:MAG: DNA photolyase family protein, partial [Gammaproteobacteria bacterium]|nr:DNA photolyase family protein [Gammaproteobacteria bacterium]
METNTIHWFRHDLRLADNPALRTAARSGRLICLYILDEAAAGRHAPGGASRWWLHHSLTKLNASLAAQGGELLLARGDTLSILPQVVSKYSAGEVHCNRVHEPWAIQLEDKVKRELADNCEFKVHEAQLLSNPDRVLNGSGQPFKVFTPYYKQLLREHVPDEPPGPPGDFEFTAVKSMDALDDWALLPQNPDWADQFPEHWSPGEQGAEESLQRFFERPVTRYADQRDIPAEPGTSRLSPHLHFGEISAARIWHATNNVIASRSADIKGGEAFLRELVWRDFSYYLLHYCPDMPAAPLREQFADFPWQQDDALLKCWQDGMTGYPLVDAGMRELWQTGWMHNRVRMVVASFLVKHLLQPWQNGMHWFYDTLVDADLANNSASWQWVAGCGADASPWFRIFNPILQSQKFDPDGDYIKRWVPELADLDGASIHEPWRLPERPNAYPDRAVIHADARQRALDAFDSLKST